MTDMQNCECYQSLTAHQHQKGHTVPKQVIMISTSSRYSLSTALCESVRYQAKSEQNVRQDLIPRVRHGEAALCTPDMQKWRTLLTIPPPNPNPYIFHINIDYVQQETFGWNEMKTVKRFLRKLG